MDHTRKWPKSKEELERESLSELISQLIKTGESFSIDYKRVGDTCRANIKIGDDDEVETN